MLNTTPAKTIIEVFAYTSLYVDYPINNHIFFVIELFGYFAKVFALYKFFPWRGVADLSPFASLTLPLHEFVPHQSHGPEAELLATDLKMSMVWKGSYS